MKNLNKTTLPKDCFPPLLKQLVECNNSKNLVAGFKAYGIVQFNPNEAMRKLQTIHCQMKFANLLVMLLLHNLKRCMVTTASKKTTQRKKLKIKPGKSVSNDDVEMYSESGLSENSDDA